jgi:proteasome lid subunit RPN8/RPN11
VLDLLPDFYADKGPERVGFILDDGSLVEVENEDPNPEQGFSVCAEDLITFGERAVATWHTHPGASSNLSMLDASAFLCWPDLTHYVIGNDGIKSYAVTNGKVVQTPGGAYNAIASARAPEAALP